MVTPTYRLRQAPRDRIPGGFAFWDPVTIGRRAISLPGVYYPVMEVMVPLDDDARTVTKGPRRPRSQIPEEWMVQYVSFWLYLYSDWHVENLLRGQR